MSSPLFRTEQAQVTPELAKVRARYDAIAADAEAIAGMPAPDVVLSTEMTVLLATEARRLDGRQWSDWLSWCGDESILWVPLDTRSPHPGNDQSLFLDDRRRIEERLWRFVDPNAWAVVPGGREVRAVTGVEAWPDPVRPSEVLVSSVLTLQHVRTQRVFSTVGRQVHRLRRDAERGWTLVQKTMLFPQLEAGSPHLGWLI